MTTTEEQLRKAMNLPSPRYYLTIEKNLRRATERYNRVKNLIPGRRRIWALDHIADDLELSAGLETLENEEYRTQLLEWSVMLRRLEFDLSLLRDEVRGETRALSRTDPRHWKGERP